MSDRALSAVGTHAAIATPHRAATEAGAAAFGEGGNAIDAALAAAVTLAVVYPHMCGVGGDLFALVRRPTGDTVGLNASGAAPRAIDVDRTRRLGHGRVPVHGPLSVTVPGTVSGWGALQGLGGELPWAMAFDAAVHAADAGTPVSRSLAAGLAWRTEDLYADPGLREVFFRDGRALGEGELLRQPALAATLAEIARRGPRHLYEGTLAPRLIGGLQRAGSPMTTEDLARHAPESVVPLGGRYRNLEIEVVPPNSQGFVLLQIVAAIERLGIDPDPLGPDAAALAQVFRAASLDRDRHNADPRAVEVPVARLLSEAHIGAMCEEVAATAAREPRRPTGDTVALVAADGDGRAVSLIQSLYDGFGSRILEPSTGIVLHNRGSAFSLDPTSPNLLAGDKRPAHTLMPVLVHRGGEPAAVAGTMGGGGQPQINAQNLVRVFDLGMEPAAALEAPRWLAGGMDLHAERFVDAEARVPVTVRAALEGAGFGVNLLRDLDEGVGHAHLLRFDADGTMTAATDPRADGAAWAS